MSQLQPKTPKPTPEVEEIEHQFKKHTASLLAYLQQIRDTGQYKCAEIELEHLISLFTSLTTRHQEETKKAVKKELEEILNCLPLRSDWDDDVKVTFKMGIDVVREGLIERIQAITPTKTDKTIEV